MIFVVLESEYNIIDSVYQKFLVKYPKDCRVFVGAKGPDAFIEKKVSVPPMFFKNWLILCNSKISNSSLLRLDPAVNTILIQVYNLKVFNEWKQREISSFEIKLVDNRKLQEGIVLDWISKELLCTQEDAKYLYKRVRGNIRDIVTNVQLLSIMKPVNKVLMRQHVTQRGRVTLNDVCPYLLGIANDYVSYQEVVCLLYSYRFAGSWIVQMLTSTLQNYLLVFKEISDGNLTMENFREFRSLQKDTLSGLSDYQYRFMIESHRKVSMEKLQYLLLRLQTMPTDFRCFFELLALLKVGGCDE